MNHNKRIFFALFVGALLALTTCTKDEDLTTPTPLAPAVEKYETKAGKSNTRKLVAQLRQATVKYHDHQVAIDDGFSNTGTCVSNPSGPGAMGVHFVHYDRIDGVHNPMEPEVLVYELRNNGTYKLVAIEYLQIGDTPPKFGGEIEFHPFSQPFAKFELHVWAWKANPAGLFEDWNPNVTCP
ncbi:hypothetical protein GGR26_000072 [Lewinella marina]|uniref:Uncharacterized protein n=1 Tax=Neolewinella marina TaxID=438751 RepID=A0A2G0CKH6_9BACT|nr:hypothetical protein [Neolewinella marina]NJB84327.1 hypothetical protein [Neolewinella marina]PHL00473.1 hypothetical protein CGL56_05425 [Neolewinella marina]